MDIRPWVVVEQPDRRGLRRISIHGKTVGTAWSLRELRKVLRSLGFPDDMDLDDGSRVYWRGGDSSVWPDGRGWRRRVVITLMLVGLLGSLALHVVIGWPDALGALTFAQRLVGVLFLLAAAVQGLALPAVIDYWGRQQFKLSGAFILLGVLMTLATTTLLLFLWLQEREFIFAAPLFLVLWLWSLWALRTLIHDGVWKGIPHPRKFAAGVTVTALLSAISLGYSIVYQPIVAPRHFALKAEFGTPKADADSPYLHVPLKLYAKNTGGIPSLILVDDYTVWGRLAEFSESGLGMEEWKGAREEGWAPDAEAFESEVEDEIVASGQFIGPATTMDPGEEFSMEKVITLPKNTEYETLEVNFAFHAIRQDRGRVDDEFSYEKLSWVESEGRYYCPPEDCGEHVIYHGRVHYNVNLINVTRKPRYVAAFWSPEEELEAFVSSFNFEDEKKSESIYDIYEGLDEDELKREAKRYGSDWFNVASEVSVKGLLKEVQP